MSRPERNDDPLAELLRSGSALSDSERQRARAAFLERVDEAREARGGLLPGRARWTWVLAPALAAAAAVALVWYWPSGELGYKVSGAEDDGGYVRASLGSPAVVQFDDETRLEAAPGARLRIGTTRSNGARVSLEAGHLNARVTHAQDTDWRFAAGPFEVHVTGTRFDLDWDAAHERLEVRLHEGSVEVTGYAGSGPVAMHAGQRFSGDARARSMLVTDLKEPVVVVPNPSDTPAVETTQADAGEAGPDAPTTDARPNPGRATKTSWDQLVSKGRFAQVIEEATQGGFERCLTSCSATDLQALADAARYTGKGSWAERALLSLRSRFAASHGARAAFLLGRSSEGLGRSAAGLEWYETSLRESPAGPFAGEALAGKMRAVQATQGRAAAAVVAREYLARFPQGVHAATARQLVEGR
ncbi:MAG TPA: FecR domain-containing protein [Polyangiaceae bacterium]|nr:FecR domain-containing protein [Polyangiaceae bacterium]